MVMKSGSADWNRWCGSAVFPTFGSVGFCKKDGPTEWIGELDVVYDEDKYNKFISR